LNILRELAFEELFQKKIADILHFDNVFNRL